MFEITQTKGDLEECARLESEVLANLAKDPRPNYTGLEADRRYFIGYRCEFGTRDWMATLADWLEFKYQVNTNGKSQRSEFLVRYGGKWNRLEVKGRGNAEHDGPFFKQIQKHDWRVVVFPHLVGGIDDPRVVVKGWWGIDDLPKMKVTRGSYDEKWNRVRPLFRLEQAFQRLQTNEEWLESYE